MKSRLTPYFIELLYDAALKSFWRKAALRRFLREVGVKDTFLTSLHEDTKREVLVQLFDKLKTHHSREAVFARMAKSLIDQKTFPDLEGWEDSTEKIFAAKQSIKHLKDYVL